MALIEIDGLPNLKMVDLSILENRWTYPLSDFIMMYGLIGLLWFNMV